MIHIDNTGKTALVFGVRNDLSLSWAIAKILHESGCRVALSYTADTRESVLKLIHSTGMDASLSGLVDVRNEVQMGDFVAAMVAQSHGIDYLLHGTAYANHSVLCTSSPDRTKPAGTYLDIDFDSLCEAFDISAYSLLRLARIAAPHCNEGASILTLTYNASRRVIPAYAGMAVAKAALENFVIYLAEHFAPRKIRVNALSPGLVMTTSAAGIQNVRRLRKTSREASPLGNVDAQAVAQAALYYFSDLSQQVTGNIHYVDGGLNVMGANNL